MAGEWLRQPTLGVLHARNSHYGVEPALYQILIQGASLVDIKVIPWELRSGNGGTIKVNRYRCKIELPGTLSIEVPSSVYLVDEVYRLYSTGNMDMILDPLDWVNDSLGFPGVLTTMSAAGLPFPHKGTRSYEILKRLNNGKGFSIHSRPSEWRRLSEYPQDEGAGEIGSIFDKESPEKWRRSYEQMCTAHRVEPNLSDDYWSDPEQVICTEGPEVTMILASIGENRVFRGDINLKHSRPIDLKSGDNGMVSGALVTMWVTPYNVDICPPPTWNTDIPQSFT